MTNLAYCGWPATVRRLALALAASTCGHAVVLANAALTPAVSEVSLLAAGEPLRARLVPAPAQPAAELTLPAQKVGHEPAPERAPPPAAVAQRPGQPANHAAGLPSAEIYFRGSELDARAIPLHQEEVAYPERALASGVSGSVTLRLLIDHAGILRDASVVDSHPAGVFENAALEAVRALRFRPAIRNGVPVGSVKIIEVPFDPDCKRTGSCIE